MGTGFLQGKASESSPPHQSASQTASPQGEAAGRGRSTALIPFVRNDSPSPPSRWAGRYGRKIQGRRPGRKKERTPAGSPQPEKVGPGRKNLFLPGVLSSGFLPKKAGPPPGAGRATGRCAPRHRKSPHHPKGTQYPAAPPPGTGREPTSQVLTCAGPRPDHLPTEAPGPTWGPPQSEKKDLANGQVLFHSIVERGPQLEDALLHHSLSNLLEASGVSTSNRL